MPADDDALARLLADGERRYVEGRAAQALTEFRPDRYDSRSVPAQWLDSGLWAPVPSGGVASIAYSAGSRTLRIRWRRSGKVSVFSGVSDVVARALFTSRGKVGFINRLVKPRFDHQYEGEGDGPPPFKPQRGAPRPPAPRR
jgi:hypothetical protein